MIILDQLGRVMDAMAARREWLTRFEGPAVADEYDQLFKTGGYRAVLDRWIALLERLNQTWEAADQWRAVGERERALDALERCVAERCTSIPFIAVHNTFRPLGGHPRFEALLARLNLQTVARRAASNPK